MPDRTATLVCDDGNDNIVYTQHIEFTDFPLDEITLYFADDAILLRRNTDGLNARAGRPCCAVPLSFNSQEYVAENVGACPDDADNQNQFDVLYATLRDLQAFSLLDSTSKVAGFLLLGTGWFATSNTTREFLQSNPFARRLFVVALAGAFFLYAFASILAFRTSQKTLQRLATLNFMPGDCYESRAVSLPVLLVFIGGNFFLCGLVAGLVLQPDLMAFRGQASATRPESVTIRAN